MSRTESDPFRPCHHRREPEEHTYELIGPPSTPSAEFLKPILACASSQQQFLGRGTIQASIKQLGSSTSKQMVVSNLTKVYWDLCPLKLARNANCQNERDQQRGRQTAPSCIIGNLRRVGRYPSIQSSPTHPSSSLLPRVFCRALGIARICSMGKGGGDSVRSLGEDGNDGGRSKTY